MSSVEQRERRRRLLWPLRSVAALCLLALPLTWLLATTTHVTPATAATPSWTAYVVLTGDNSVVPIDTGDNTAGTPISFSGVVSEPAGIAINPTATTAYVSNFSGDDITPVDLSTGTRGTLLALTGPASGAYGVALPPTGSASTVLVTNENAGAVDPVDPSTDEVGTPIPTGSLPTGIAITPNGAEAYVANNGGTTVTPIDLSTDTAGPDITVGSGPFSIAITPNGADAYVANSAGPGVSVIDTSTNTVSATIPFSLSAAPTAVAVSPDGSTVYVTTTGNTVEVIDVATNTVTGTIPVGTTPMALAVTPDGAEVYVANEGDGSVSVIDTATDSVAATIPVGTGSQPAAIAITPDQAPSAAVTVSPAAAGTPTTFDASSSSVAFGTIASYTWTFGDGMSAVTTSPTTTHTYASAGNYTASVTETSSGGTSTTTVFTGQSMSRNGGPSATTTIGVVVPAAPPPPPPPSPPAAPSPAATPAPVVVTATSPLSPIFLGTPPSGIPKLAVLPFQGTTLPGPPTPTPIPTPTSAPSTPPSRRHHRATNSLTSVPDAGTPGMAVTVNDDRLPSTCAPSHTIDVLFDNRLVTQAPAVGRTFVDDDVVIPGDAATGGHHLALSCADGGPALASASFDVTSSDDHPMGWVTSLPRPGNLDTSATTFAASFGLAAGLLALILVYLVGFPSKWFNSTYDANHERMLEAARRRFPRLMAARAAAHQHVRRVAVPLTFLFFVALAALIHSALDPNFGWNLPSLWLWLGWCGGVTVVALGFQLPAMLHGTRVRGTHHVEMRILLGSFLVAVACVLVSRLLSLQPGYCYGLLAVFAFMPALAPHIKGRIAAVSAVLVLALSLIAWFIWVPLERAASHPHPSPGILVVEAFLGVVFILGLESVSFGMLPLPFLPGRDVWAWNRWIWGALFSLGTFGFVWVLLQPGSGYSERVRHLDLIPVAVTCAVFAGCTLAFMAYFKFRKPGPRAVDGSEAPIGFAD